MFARALLSAVLAVFLSSALVPSVSAWGGQGHNATARLAQTLFTSAASKLALTLLPDKGGQIDTISSWADNVRSLTNWSWSYGMHFADTPDWACNYNVDRDCAYQGVGGRCVDGAVRNYTARLQNATLDDWTQYREALEFLVHFVGDLHQPLHGGFIGDIGGNSIYVNFTYGNSANLHSLWDSGLIARRVQADFSNNYRLWDAHLLKLLQTTYKENATTWLTCEGGVQPGQFIPCSGQWVGESAALCCQSVYIDDQGQNMTRNSRTSAYQLGDVYYQRNIEFVEMRIIQAGVRMAYIINTVAAAMEPAQSSSSSSSSSAASSSSSSYPASSSSSSDSSSSYTGSSSSDSSSSPSSWVTSSMSTSSPEPYTSLSSTAASSSSSSLAVSNSSTGEAGHEEKSGISALDIVVVLLVVVLVLIAVVFGFLYWRKRKHGLNSLFESPAGTTSSGRSRLLLDDDDSSTAYTRA